jgi:hypothetical protein
VISKKEYNTLLKEHKQNDLDKKRKGTEANQASFNKWYSVCIFGDK